MKSSPKHSSKSSRYARPAQPFDGLLGMGPKSRPAAERVTLVVAGTVVTDVRQINSALVGDVRDDDEAILEARRLAQAVRKAHKSAQDRRYNQSEAGRAKRAAWRQENAARIDELRRRWRAKNPKHARERDAEYARRRYYHDAEAMRAKARERYWANREAFLQRARDYRARKKAEAASAASATQGSQP